MAKRMAAIAAVAVLLLQNSLGFRSDVQASEGSDTVDSKPTVIGTSFNPDKATDEKYAYWRIPGMIVTSENTVITYYEARANGTDYDGIDIIAYRSEDGGDTFGEPIVLASGFESGTTMNNPVMIADENGIVHFLYCVNYGVCSTCNAAATSACAHGAGVFYRKSADDGKTWSEPVNISDATDPTFHDVIATGPTHGIRTSAGALVVPVWMVKKGQGWSLTSHGGPAGAVVVSTLYSTDGGANWQLGELVPHDSAVVNLPNETAIVETFDGKIMINSRMDGVGYRAVAYSETGYSDWTPYEIDEALIDPTCCGGLASYSAKDATEDNTILFVNCEHGTSRTNLTIKGSTDNGKTWKYRKVLATYAAGYADVAVDANGTIYVLMEVSSGQYCRLFRMDYDTFVADSVTALSDLTITGASQEFVYDHKVAYTVTADAGAALSVSAKAYNPDAVILIGGQVYTPGQVYTHTVTVGGAPLEIVVSYGGRSTTYTVTFAPKAAANSMVMHLNGESLADQTVYGNTPTVTGVTVSTDSFKFGGGSLLFDGSTAYLNAESTACINPGTDDFTVAAWINADSVADQHVLFWYGDTSQFWCRTNGDDLQANIKGNGLSETTVTAENVITAGTWTHIAYTRTGTTHTLYVNGAAVATAASAAVHDLSGYDGLTIGRARTTWYRYFDGYMDEFKVFNYALSAEELSTLVTTNTLMAVSAGTLSGEGTLLFAVGEGQPVASIKEVAEGTTVTVTATPADGYLLVPGSLTYTKADGTTAKILNKNLENADFGNGTGYTYQFAMPSEAVRVNVTFAETTANTFCLDTVGASVHVAKDGTYDGIRFLTRLALDRFDTAADAISVTYNGEVYTVKSIGALLKRADNTTELTLENSALNTNGAGTIWKAVAYDAAQSPYLKVVDYTDSYLDVQVVMMKHDSTSTSVFRKRQFTARGYLVLVDAAGRETVLYADNMLTKSVKDITPPQTLKPEFGDVELEAPTTTTTMDYFPGSW
ncbi:MAG: exo-alpha-sialidase [Clostridia bacterium]|nr:exo-alpha-sialidase [Clostridia bacterium]